MDNILETIKYLPENTLPKNFQRKTYRRILIVKLRPFIYSLTLILLASLGYLSIHIYRHLVESEAITVIRVMFEDLDWSADYFLNIFAGLKEVLPLYKMLLLTLNLTAVVYLLSLFRRYRHELLKI